MSPMPNPETLAELATAITARDVADLRRLEQELQLARRSAELARVAAEASRLQLTQTLGALADAVVVVNLGQVVLLANRAAEDLFGWALGDVRGRPLVDVCPLFTGSDRPALPALVARAVAQAGTVRLPVPGQLAGREGEALQRYIDANATVLHDLEGYANGVVLTLHDVTQQRRAHETLLRLNQLDVLTGLLGRREFARRAQQLLEGGAVQLHAMALSAERDGAGADLLTLPAVPGHVLCYLDLDQFKLINDTCGHAAGDRLLREVAALLSGCIREGDLLARMGGDEFAALLPHCDMEQGLAIAERMRERIGAYRLLHEGGALVTGVSIGVVPIEPGCTDLGVVFADADLACYAAKEAGRNCLHLLSPGDTVVATRRREMQQLGLARRALEDNRLLLYVQPIVPACPRRREGPDAPPPYAEVLLRLRNEDGSVIGPSQFIPAAERYGQMVAIDRWVVEAAMTLLRRTHRLELSVNLSGASLGSREFMAEVVERVDREPALAGRLILEVTESAAISNLDQARRFMAALKARGVRFALDDFGSGLSSLSYIKNLPVNCIKLDGVFIRDIATDPLSASIVAAVCGIAATMGVCTVAECVEAPEDVQRLAEIGVDYIQGYATGRPRPVEDYIAEQGLAADSGPGASSAP